MIVRVASLSLLASLWTVEEASAFSPAWRRAAPLSTGLRVQSYEEMVTDCVQEAVDYIEDETTSDKVRIESDFPEIDTTKKELLSDIQDVMDGVEDEVAADQEISGDAEPGKEVFNSALMNDIAKKFHFFKDDEPDLVTAEEAAVSASLYMNPATEKIAKNLIVTWEPQAAETLLSLERVSNPNRPFMVGVVGIPGSGKSTSAEIMAALMGEERAIVMPMDGFHIPLADLAEFPNPADAIYRRGAPDTFNAKALGEELKRIAYGDEDTVTIPGFDHAVGDPTPNQHTFKRDEHRIVICEGLYLLHDDHGWENIKSFFDWTIYIDADVDGCIERLKERNKCIPGYTAEEIEVRCDEVDRVNAETSRDGAYQYASQIVSSGAN